MGSITLLVSVGLGPCTTTTMMNFLVVRTRSMYKAIIGQPMLNALREITSTYHLKKKFPMEPDIGEVCGEQVLA